MAADARRVRFKMTKTLFRCVVAGSIALLLASVVALLFVDHPLPAALDAWVEAEANAEWSAVDWFGTAVALVSMVASIGLFFFARWARHAYTASVVAITVTTLFIGPSVSTALEMFFSEVTLLVDGFIIGLAYFSEARHYFDAKPRSSALRATTHVQADNSEAS